MAKLLWTQRANFGPSPRSGCGMAYDSIRGRTVLFGGFGPVDPNNPEKGDGPLGDTWEWDGVFWTQMQDTGPAPRRSMAMAYDSARQMTLLFGGDGAARFGDTWRWNGADWTKLTESGPQAREQSAMAFDSNRSRAVLFGGVYFADTWEFDGENWTQQEDTGPSRRAGHSMAYDGAGNRTLLFGGYFNGDQTIFGDTWAWDGQEWVQIGEFGPSARAFASMASDGGSPILYGGATSGLRGPPPTLADTWEFDGRRWTQRQDIGPGPLVEAAMVFDAARGRTVLFGGTRAGGQFSAATWEAAVDSQAAAPL